jgi:imidazole glycerol-phosphate synthase subunit HisF
VVKVLTKRIIPCMDVKDSRVVKGTKFVNLKDAGSPTELARFYDKENADELVFLDITASAQKRKTIVSLVKDVASQVFIPLTVGGGISSIEDIKAVLSAGADKVSINTAAVKKPSFIEKAASRFGSQCIVVAIDAKRSAIGWEVMVNAGKQNTGKDVLDWAREAENLGAGEILLTSIDADGTKAGYDIELTRMVSEASGIPVIASGGAGSMQTVLDAFQNGKADAALIASSFHYGNYSVNELKEFLKNNGVVVRK